MATAGTGACLDQGRAWELEMKARVDVGSICLSVRHVRINRRVFVFGAAPHGTGWVLVPGGTAGRWVEHVAPPSVTQLAHA